MKTRNGAFWGITGAVLASICGCSLCSAQLVTQPPVKAPNPADNIPRAPMPAPKPAPVDLHQPAPPPPQPAPTKVKPVLPDLPYPPLLQKDAKGNDILLIEPADYAALRVNPMLKPEDLTKFTPYLNERRANFERIVISNLDLVEQIEGGIFEKLDLTDNKAFTQLLNVSKPLRAPSAPKALTDELADRSLLDPTQAEFNRKIVREYHLAVIPPMKPDATPDEKGKYARRSLALFYKQGVDEPLFVHRQLKLEASSKLSKVLSELKLDKATADKVGAIAATIQPATGDDARLKAMADIESSLSVDQRKDLLRAVVSLRQK